MTNHIVEIVTHGKDEGRVDSASNNIHAGRSGNLTGLGVGRSALATCEIEKNKLTKQYLSDALISGECM